LNSAKEKFDESQAEGKTPRLYLLNYFKPGLGEQTPQAAAGRQKFTQLGCAQCHVPDLQLNRDRRVADVETVYDPVYDPVNGIFNGLFATAVPRFTATDDGSGHPTLKRPASRGRPSDAFPDRQ